MYIPRGSAKDELSPNGMFTVLVSNKTLRSFLRLSFCRKLNNQIITKSKRFKFNSNRPLKCLKPIYFKTEPAEKGIRWVNPFTPKSAEFKTEGKSWILFCKIVKKKLRQYHMKVLLNSFHLNGHTLISSTDSKGTATFIDPKFDSGSERFKMFQL